MDILKKFFPLSFEMNDVAKLVIAIIIYVVIDIVLGTLVFIACMILPIFSVIFNLIGSLGGVYTTAGIVIAVLDFCKILK